MSVGGPDAFGYTYDDTVSYSWVTASTNTTLTGDDATSGAMNIGFNFPFYESNYSQLFFNTNGGVTFGSGSTNFGGFPIPTADVPNNFIAPLWDDIVVGSPYNTGAIYYSQGGTAPDRYFILEWRDVTTFGGSNPFSFEVILHENGDIVIQHQSVPELYSSSVGIENIAGSVGLQYQFGNSGLSSSKAIRFYYPTTLTTRVYSIVCANPNPTAAAIVKFTVIFSEPVTGVDTVVPFADFSLTTSPGISGASITGVSGSGTTYTVTVNTGNDNGTIRLDVLDNNSIVNAALNPLGGAAVGDGNFTTGDFYTINRLGGDTTGVFRPTNGALYLKNANTTGYADISINYGLPGDYPVVGDWDGNGTDTIGVYRNGVFYLRNSNTIGYGEIAVTFGGPGDEPFPEIGMEMG